MIRLGEGVDARRILSDAAIERLIETLREFQSLADHWNATGIKVVGTSASRDARNRLVEIVEERTGLHYEIISGDQEADLSFEGALAGLPHLSGRIISCDIGGGSTEFVEGTSDGQILTRISIDIGSVRITERFFSSQPPRTSEVDAARGFIQESLKRLPFTEPASATLVGASDTHFLLLGLQRALVKGEYSIWCSSSNPIWTRLRGTGVDSKTLSIEQVESWLECLTQMTVSEVMDLDPGNLKGRADVFPSAILIMFEVMNHLRHRSVAVSPWGLCHGVALRAIKCGALQ